MVRRVYLFLLICFILFVVGLNTLTFFAGTKSRQTVSLFYLSERSVAVMLLLEHIIFESGVVLHQPSYEDIWQTVWEECSGTPVDPELVMLIINGYENRGLFNIDFDGSMGLMRTKPHMLQDMMGINPYILRDNIKVGVTYLSVLMEKERRLDVLLCEYLKPESSRTVFEKDVAAANEYATRIYNDYMRIKPHKPRQDPAVNEIIPFPAYL